MQPELIGGRYRVLRAVGRGGMGTVWLARDELLHREVAVKQVGLLPGESVTDSARALREARSSAALSHRNVVTVFDVVEQDGIWLVMEYVPSRSLADLVAQEGPLEPAVVADIGAQVADGLAAAHAVGTMHRDVKPGNVLVRDDGLAKVSDFGIARSAGDPALTQSGLLTGTPSYFSPELARGAAPTPASDVWALGATLYAAVEGQPPYPLHANPIAMLHDIASRQPPPPGRAGNLEPLLLRMLDRDPESRWSMTDAAHALRRLADEHRTGQTLAQTLAQTRAWTRPGPAGVERVGRDEGASGGHDAGEVRRDGASGGNDVRAVRRDGASGGNDVRAVRRDGASGGASGDAIRGRSAGRGRSRRGPYVLLAIVALLVLAGVGYALLHQASDGSDHTASKGPTSSPRASSSTSASVDTSSGSGSPSTSPGAGRSASAPASGSSAGASGSSAGASGSPSLAAKAAFLRGYFQVAGTDEGWAKLGSDERSVGRASYDRFWGTIDSASVSDVSNGGDGDTVEATIRYRYSDGRVVEERQRLSLVTAGDGFLIDEDDVLSSRTLSS